jgi:uncharacterized protein
MAKPAVVQFEITGKDSAALKTFYASLFGWQMYATPTPGFYVVGANENGIPGSIGASRDGGPGQVAFYVEVDDLEQHVSYAEELGGRIVRPPYEVRSPDGKFAYAFVADPEGHVMGLSHGLEQALARVARKES